MSKILSKTIVEIPKNVSVGKGGHVYLNASTKWVNSKDKSHKYADHDRVYIGRAVTFDTPGANWRDDPRMYPNDNYYIHVLKQEPPQTSKSSGHESTVSLGPFVVLRKIAEESGLLDILSQVFDDKKIVDLILDLAMCFSVRESGVFQRAPAWLKQHATFSETIRNDTSISKINNSKITTSHFDRFRYLWAKHSIGAGKINVSYDSTNVNSQAEGVTLVSRGHAKDKKNLPQVNVEYVVRQDDGLPIAFSLYPGFINDISESPQMIEFFKDIKEDLKEEDKESKLEILITADRAYLSEENMSRMEAANIDFLLMLKTSMDMTYTLIDEHADEVRDMDNYIETHDRFAKTYEIPLEDNKIRYFHIVWDETYARKNRQKLHKDITNAEKKLNELIEKKTRVTERELDKYSKFFKVETKPAGEVTKLKRTIPVFTVESIVEKKSDIIKLLLKRCGYFILVTSKDIPKEEALEAYSKRGCIEKLFSTLKSHLGMDKFGSCTDESMHAKLLMWFIASIMRNILLNKTKHLRDKDRKSFTVPGIFDLLEPIKAHRNRNDRKYRKDFTLLDKQKQILRAFKISEKDIEETIENLWP